MSELPVRLSRAERKERRTHKQLRCEWCNRRTPVSKRIWKEVSRDQEYHYLSAEEILENMAMSIYCCGRARCIRSRPPEWQDAVNVLFWMGGTSDE